MLVLKVVLFPTFLRNWRKVFLATSGTYKGNIQRKHEQQGIQRISGHRQKSHLPGKEKHDKPMITRKHEFFKIITF